MKVHIVYIDPNGDKIVERLMRLLAERTGWTISTRPDDKADLNYCGLYIDFAQRFTDWRKTKWAAYFSHYETGTPYKEFWWQNAERLVDIKTVTANQYGAMLQGNVIKVTPPIDSDMFAPTKRKASKIPTIGVSGFVDNSGRKGEALIARLAHDFEGKINFVASGHGWPVKIVNKTLAGLPAFYNKLDYYLCASTIEGIPITPLEAMACGCGAIVPRGVGMLDELPDIDGVHRFEPGDYDSLKTAVSSIIGAKRDPEQLRNVITSTYTPEAWAKSHADGFKRALKLSSKVALSGMERSDGGGESDRHGQRGVYYVAYGEPARKCAQAAMKSFSDAFPTIPIVYASDRKITGQFSASLVNFPDYDIGGRAAKLSVYDATPKDWNYVAYLDADTEVIEASTFLWDTIEAGWDMVICTNPSRFHVAGAMRRGDNNDECDATYQQIGAEQVLQLNGGVFAFRRNARTRAFFASWLEEWKLYEGRDQAALLRALWKHPLKLLVLGNEWNTVVRYNSPDMAAWLLHYPMTARRWRGKIAGKLSDPIAWSAVQKFTEADK